MFEKQKQLFEQLIDQHNLSAPTRNNIIRLFGEYGVEIVFSRADVKKVCDITDNLAGTLINKMKDLQLIEAVAGSGKGKYRFRLIDD